MTGVRLAAILAAVLSVTGCTGHNWDYLFGGGRAKTAGVLPNIDDRYERVDLISALVRDKKLREELQGALAAATSDTEASAVLQLAYHAFNTENGDTDAGKRRRDEIQDELMRASEQRCNFYKLHLQTHQSSARFIFGATTTVLGGLGAIFTATNTARALAGAAGIVSGVNAEYQEAYFAGLAVHVLTTGIEDARKVVFEGTRKRRKDASLSDYTIQLAIHDAVQYHSACSILEGLKAANAAQSTMRQPGPEFMKWTVDQVGILKKKLDDASAGITIDQGVSFGPAFVQGAGGSGGASAAEGGSGLLPSQVLAQKAGSRIQELELVSARLIALRKEVKSAEATPTIDAIEEAMKRLRDAFNAKIALLATPAKMRTDAIVKADTDVLAAKNDDERSTARIARATALSEATQKVYRPLESDVAKIDAALREARLQMSGGPRLDKLTTAVEAITNGATLLKAQ